MSNDLFQKNKLFNKNNFSNWIIGGVIALIITKISDPLGEFLFSSILNIGGGFITHISNITYKEISNGFSEQSSSVVLYFSFLLFACLFVNMYLSLFQSHKATKEKINKLFASNDNSSKNYEKNNNKTSDNLNEPDLEALKKEGKKILQLNNLNFLFGTLFFLLVILLITFIYGQSSFIRSKTITLTNNIEIVSPYITDTEYKQLKSQFHLIETQFDYDKLMEELETIADKYSLNLK